VRILHLTDHYLPVLGGIESHVAALAGRYALNGHDVTVLTSTATTADGQHARDSGPVSVRRARSLREGLTFDFAAFDVVHAHLSVVAPFSAPLAAIAARRGVPTVVTVHSLWNGLGPVPAVAAGLAGLRAAPVMWTAVSRVAAHQLAQRLPGAQRVELLPNAVSESPRRQTPPPRADGAVRLVSTMRVARRKRPVQLLSMYESLCESVAAPVDLTIVGDGPLRPRLERRIRRAGLQDRVEVTGRLTPAEVLATIAEADVYVAPAVLESFGLAALEARCVGLPVVGHAASGMTEFVRHGVEGLLSESDEQMVGQLADLVTDAGLRRRMSEHNRTTASPLTWENAVARHDATYAAVCSPSYAPVVPLSKGAGR
jgi:glycosyltransferase involved in cell wall biosynthesis